MLRNYRWKSQVYLRELFSGKIQLVRSLHRLFFSFRLKLLAWMMMVELYKSAAEIKAYKHAHAVTVFPLFFGDKFLWLLRICILLFLACSFKINRFYRAWWQKQTLYIVYHVSAWLQHIIVFDNGHYRTDCSSFGSSVAQNKLEVVGYLASFSVYEGFKSRNSQRQHL